MKGSKGRPGERFAATLALSLPATASQTVEVKVETNPEREWNLTNLRRLRCSVLRVPLLCSLPRGVLGLREQVVGRCQVSVQRLGALQCVACWQSVTRDHLGEKREGRALRICVLQAAMVGAAAAAQRRIIDSWSDQRRGWRTSGCRLAACSSSDSRPRSHEVRCGDTESRVQNKGSRILEVCTGMAPVGWRRNTHLLAKWLSSLRSCRATAASPGE